MFLAGHLPAAAQDGVWRYSVRPGDNIWDLSRRYLADWRNWTVIQELNGIDEPRGIPPGSRLDIPLHLLRLDPAAATLVDVSGPFTLVRGGAALAAAPGAELRIGDRLLTGDGASAVVRFADRSTVVLGSDSELVLDRLAQYRGTGMVDTRLRLERGRLETAVQPAVGSGSHFEVWTPPAVSSVRGTDLRVGLDDAAEQSATEVLNGTVEVAALATLRRVPGGFGTVTRQGEPPAPPRPLLEPPAAEDLPLTLERLPLRLPMPPLTGAERFRLALADDASFQRLLFDEVVEAGGAARLDLPDGSYAARMRGIEADGLEGRDQVWQLEIFARPEPPTPLAPQRDGRLRDPLPQFGWSEPLDAAGYRFALATDPDFTAPLVETDTLTSPGFTPTAPLPLGTYYWRLGTIDADGRRGPWGEALSFEVLAPPADPAIAETDRDGGRFTIRLSALEPGQRVRFQIASDAAFDDILSDQTVDEPVLVVPGLLPDDYWFRAQIIEADGYVADFSTPQRITVPPVSWWPYLLISPSPSSYSCSSMPLGPVPSIRAGFVLMLFAVTVASGLHSIGLAARIDLALFDRWAPRFAATGDERLVVVEIDQQSLERLGRWPWPRHLHATLIDRLAAGGPRVIGYDVLFAEPASGEPDGDAALGSAIARAGNVVLPLIAEPPARGLPPLEILPFGDLAGLAAALGHSHLAVDADGRLRRLHLRAGVGDAYWPALARAVQSVAEQAMPEATTVDGPGASAFPDFLGWASADEVLVPIPTEPRHLRHYSAVDVLNRQLPSELADAVVIVGATARGLKAWVDIGPASAATRIPPVYFNAFAVEALLAGKMLIPIRQPGPIAAMLAAGAFLPWLSSTLYRRRAQLALLVLTPVVPVGVGLAALVGWRVVLPFGSVAVSILLVFAAALLLSFGQRLRQARLERVLAHAALTNVADAVLTTDAAKVVDYANPAAERLLAADPGKLVGRPVESVAPAIAALLEREAEGRGPSRQPSERNAGRTNDWRTLQLDEAGGGVRIVKAAVRRLGRSQQSGYVIALNDVTDEQRLLDEVAFRATHDGLTKLPNRHLLIDRLSSAIERGRRRDRLVVVAFLDVDRLKSINDALGHAVGDAVLVELAGRLTSLGRATDTVARLGGDEFVLMLDDLRCRSEVEAAVTRYRRSLIEPVVVDGRRFHIKASIGVACFPNDGQNPDELLRRADTAMYRAKSGGRDQVVFFDANLHGDESGGLLLDAALRQGIDRDELELHYQPRIDLVHRRPAGVESLVRWHHPEQGFLPPGRFIGLAEETGSIVELGRWVVARACADLAGAALRDTDLRLSINLSVVQLKRDQGFVDFVRATLARHHLAPDRLELEVTESLFLDPSLPMLGRKLADLASLGVHLSIDDFGTGYSSLAYINRFPFDRIKIDRSFVHAVGQDKGSQAIVRAIVGLSEALAKKTTAEGVEEADQLAFLDELHCNEAQGYFFGRPVPLPQLLDQLAA